MTTCAPRSSSWSPRASSLDLLFIIDPLDSLKAYKDSSVAMMKSRSRLLALGDHELDRGAHFAVGKRRVAALGRHRALAFQRRLQQAIRAVHEVRRPRRLVAELRRAGDAARVAGAARRLVDLLAVGLLRRGG